MLDVDVYNLENKKVDSLELANEVFGVTESAHLIWEVVKCQRARMRKGTACTKTRAQVRGSNAKPFRQKGTGRARQGTRHSAPHQRGGGVAFGPHPRSYAYQVPKKVRHKALCAQLSAQLSTSKLKVIENFAFEKPKTKHLVEILKVFGVDKALLVDSKDNRNLKLSARNIPNFAFRPVEGINLVELLQFENLIITKSSVKQIEAGLL